MLLFFNSSLSTNRSSGSVLWPGFFVVVVGGFCCYFFVEGFFYLFVLLACGFSSQVEAEALASLLSVIMI